MYPTQKALYMLYNYIIICHCIYYIYILIVYTAYCILYTVCHRCILGAIEVATHTDKMAEQTVHLADEMSGDEDGVAASVFEQAQKKVRVTSTTNEENEISLKLPKADGNDDDELHSLLWGKTTNDSDDENDKKRRAAASGGANRNRRPRLGETPQDPANGVSTSAGSGQGGDAALWGLSSIQPSASRKTTQESKELDKIEGLVLQAKQLIQMLEDPRTVMQVTVAKARSMVDKLQTKRSEDTTKMVLEIVRVQGSSCRASKVWDDLNHTKSVVEGVVEFVEALHDQEATTETLRSKSKNLADLGVNLPQSVSMVICRRFAEHLLGQGKLDEVFKLLDPAQSKDMPDGIGSVLPQNEPKEKVDAFVVDFQSGCIIHCINQILLRDAPAPEENGFLDPNTKIAKIVFF